MTKKLLYNFLIFVFVFSALSAITPAQAKSDYNGKLVKMDNLSTIYYVASDGKRYVFPSVNVYKSWFTDFENVETLDSEELTSIPLGGNVRYRPGILLVKITTDPKVYAVSNNGKLRWIKTEAMARELYGDNWNLLIDDVSDSFFTNYNIGDPIDSIADFDPEDESENVDNIDSNRGMSYAHAQKAQTRKCQIANSSRNCRAHNNPAREGTPYIKNINVHNRGETGYIDINDQITITFNEAIDPTSINEDLQAGDYYSTLDDSIVGSIYVDEDGILSVKNILSFDIGSVKDTGRFAVRLELNSNAKTLTVIILSGESIEIRNEHFSEAKQIGGTITDVSGVEMEEKKGLDEPGGTFGGESEGDDVDPSIRGIKVYNGDSESHIDVNDKIIITFSEEIDPSSIHPDLEIDGSVEDVDSDETGGVIIENDGTLTVTNIAQFDTGDVSDDTEFDVRLELDESGKKLTIALTNGYDVELNEDLDDAEQIGDYVEDLEGNEMDDDSTIGDPEGSFLTTSAAGVLIIKEVEVRDEGFTGYIDEDDEIIITFSNEITSRAIDVEPGETSLAEAYSTGGIYVTAEGILHVTDIVSFDVGEVEKASEFETKLELSSNGEVLTVTLRNGDKIEIEDEDFDNTTQIGGYLEDEDGNVMDDAENIEDPEGSFGGGSSDTPPYIVGIEIENKGLSRTIDLKDEITITFNEKINPESIDNDLVYGGTIENVDDDDTGGVILDEEGFLTITGITVFYVGEVESDEEYDTDISLNEDGNELTIKIAKGDDAEITNQDLDNAKQIEDIIEDDDGEFMEYDSRIRDPEGSF